MLSKYEENWASFRSCSQTGNELKDGNRYEVESEARSSEGEASGKSPSTDAECGREGRQGECVEVKIKGVKQWAKMQTGEGETRVRSHKCAVLRGTRW